MRNAINTEWECKSCGSKRVKSEVLNTNLGKTKYSFTPPEKCACGAKSNFMLLAFQQANSIIVDDTQMEKIAQVLKS